jgi:uncharacterized protein YfiM (DUF2279 family)
MHGHRRLLPVSMPILTLVVALGAAVSVIASAGARPQTNTPSAETTSAAADAARLRAYDERIAVAARSGTNDIPLPQLLRSLVSMAAARSSERGAVEENRAAIVALTFYVNRWPLAVLSADARTWPVPATRRVVLRGREDLAQHFMVSALISAASGTALASAAGLYKEVSDTRRGSGFSFSDLAADRAGTVFGQLATRSPDSARQLQSHIAGGLAEDDMMPAIDGLPDNLSDAELTRRFGGVGGVGYTAMVREIDQRVANLALYRAPPSGPDAAR